MKDSAAIQQERQKIAAFNAANDPSTTSIDNIDLTNSAVTSLDAQGLRKLIEEKKREIREKYLKTNDAAVLALQDTFKVISSGASGAPAGSSLAAGGTIDTNLEYRRLRERFMASGNPADAQAVKDFENLWTVAGGLDIANLNTLTSDQLRAAVKDKSLATMNGAFNRVIAPLRDDASAFANDPSKAPTKISKEEADRALFLVQNNLVTGQDLQHALALLIAAKAQGLAVANLPTAIDGITDTSIDKQTYKQYAANTADRYWLETLLENPENMLQLNDAVSALKENNAKINDLLATINDKTKSVEDRKKAQDVLDSLGLRYKESFTVSDDGASHTVNVFERDGASYFIPDTAAVRDARDDAWKKPTGSIKDADGNARDVLGDDFYRELFKEGIIDPFSDGGNAKNGLANLRFARDDSRRLVLAADDSTEGTRKNHQCAQVASSVYCADGGRMVNVLLGTVSLSDAEALGATSSDGKKVDEKMLGNILINRDGRILADGLLRQDVVAVATGSGASATTTLARRSYALDVGVPVFRVGEGAAAEYCVLVNNRCFDVDLKEFITPDLRDRAGTSQEDVEKYIAARQGWQRFATTLWTGPHGIGRAFADKINKKLGWEEEVEENLKGTFFTPQKWEEQMCKNVFDHEFPQDVQFGVDRRGNKIITMNINAEREKIPVSLESRSSGEGTYNFVTLYQITWLVRPAEEQRGKDKLEEIKYTLCGGSCSNCAVIRNVKDISVRPDQVSSDFVALYSQENFATVSLCYVEKVGGSYGGLREYQAPIVDENYVPDGTVGAGRGPSSAPTQSAGSSLPAGSHDLAEVQ